MPITFYRVINLLNYSVYKNRHFNHFFSTFAAIIEQYNEKDNQRRTWQTLTRGVS